MHRAQSTTPDERGRKSIVYCFFDYQFIHRQEASSWSSVKAIPVLREQRHHVVPLMSLYRLPIASADPTFVSESHLATFCQHHSWR